MHWCKSDYKLRMYTFFKKNLLINASHVLQRKICVHACCYYLNFCSLSYILLFKSRFITENNDSYINLENFLFVVFTLNFYDKSISIIRSLIYKCCVWWEKMAISESMVDKVYLPCNFPALLLCIFSQTNWRFPH